MPEYRKKLKIDFGFMSYAPMIFISAKPASASTGCLS